MTSTSTGSLIEAGGGRRVVEHDDDFEGRLPLGGNGGRLGLGLDRAVDARIVGQYDDNPLALVEYGLIGGGEVDGHHALAGGSAEDRHSGSEQGPGFEEPIRNSDGPGHEQYVGRPHGPIGLHPGCVLQFHQGGERRIVEHAARNEGVPGGVAEAEKRFLQGEDVVSFGAFGLEEDPGDGCSPHR